jgi:hypothetical protein
MVLPSSMKGAKMKRLLAGLLVLATGVAAAEEFGDVVTVGGDTPTVVMFLRCRSLQRDVGDENRPTICKGREEKATFRAKAARITNLGESVAWLHVGEDKVPLLPKSVTTFGPLESVSDRLFLSAPDGPARVHVFASTEVVLDRSYIHPEPEKPRR